jgi:integrase
MTEIPKISVRKSEYKGYSLIVGDKEYLFPDKQTAERKARELGNKLKMLNEPEPEPETAFVLPTFSAYCKTWIDEIRHTRRGSTLERYQGLLKKFILPEIGKMRLDEITRGSLRKLLLKYYKGGLSKSSVSLISNTLSGIFEYAIDDELLEKNPVTGLIRRLHLERGESEQIKVITREQVDAVLSVCDREQYCFFLTAFRTGMRRGELLALEWNDIDFERGRILVNKSCRRGVLSKTKTGKKRYVEMSAHLAETLKGLYRRRKQEALDRRKRKPFPVIFHRKGKYLSQTTLERTFKRLLKKAGVPKIRVHDIRHTYASLLLSQGVTPVYVKDQMGHDSIRTTVDIYGHWIPTSGERHVDRLD